jgi:diguanylate cyclase (GGDEF)-like protein/PAS domain S-box-containing protein
MIESDVLGALLLDMFAFSPVAISISTVGYETSRYIRVNDAYLQLVGCTWEELRGRNLSEVGTVVSNPARVRRLRLLDEEGGYQLEEATLRRSDGQLVPTLISARRTEHDGKLYDVEIIIDMTERERMQRDLEFYLRAAAYTDPLTGLPNRASFDRQLETITAEAEAGTVTVLAFIDMTKFKAVNDRFGHAMGDALLRAVAGRLRGGLGPNDFAARLGGDEFGLLLRTTPDRAGHSPARVRSLLETVFKPFEIEEQHLVVGAACGLALQDGPADTGFLLLRRADTQMYRAKASGALIDLCYADGDFSRPPAEAAAPGG